MNEDKATRYHRLRRRTRYLGAAGGVVLLGAFWTSGASVWLRQTVEALVQPVAAEPWASGLVVALYLLALAVVAEVVAFPMAVYRTHVLDRRYGLSTETFRDWLHSHVKGTLIGVGLALLAGSVAYAFIRWSPTWWWLPTAGVFFTGTLVLAFAAPVLLFPLFFKFEPLDREALVARLVALATKAGTRVLGVYEWKLSDRTRSANAALVGLGGTRRILLSDTLLSSYSDDEIEVILAHELAHHVHGDLWKVLVLDAVLTLGALLAAHLGLLAAVRSGTLAAPDDVAGVPVAVLAAGAWSVLTVPLLNALSRRHERQADRFALDLTRNPEAFISAMRRLGAQNLAEQAPSRLTEWLFHSHPPLPERMEAARAWVAPADSPH